MNEDYRRGLITGLSMQPLYVVGGGIINTPDFDLTGINGMFTPETRDIGNGLWRNQLGGNDIILTGGSAVGDALHFTPTDTGTYTCAEPNTVYAIVKTPAADICNCVLTKKVTILSGSARYGFNLLQNHGKLYFSAATYDVAQTAFPCDEYHVYCFTRTGNRTYFYVDGAFVGNLSPNYTGYYGGLIYLNDELFGDRKIDESTTCDFIMCAFGTVYHDGITIIKNVINLANTYGIKIF